jgi:hypothetical protein
MDDHVRPDNEQEGTTGDEWTNVMWNPTDSTDPKNLNLVFVL